MGISVPCSLSQKDPILCCLAQSPRARSFSISPLSEWWMVATSSASSCQCWAWSEVPWAVCKIPANCNLIFSCARLWHQRLIYYQADLDMSNSDIPNKCLLTENTDKLAHAPFPSNGVLFSALSFPMWVRSQRPWSPVQQDWLPPSCRLLCNAPSPAWSPEPSGVRSCRQRDAKLIYW